MNNRSGKLITFRATLIISLLLMALLLVGLGISCKSPASDVPPTTPPTTKIAIAGFAFKPAEITIPVGSTVTWYNEDTVTHTVTSQNKLFDSGSLATGGMFSYTFEQKGTFEYHCMFHPYMKGKVIVE